MPETLIGIPIATLNTISGTGTNYAGYYWVVDADGNPGFALFGGGRHRRYLPQCNAHEHVAHAIAADVHGGHAVVRLPQVFVPDHLLDSATIPHLANTRTES